MLKKNNQNDASNNTIKYTQYLMRQALFMNKFQREERIMDCSYYALKLCKNLLFILFVFLFLITCQNNSTQSAKPNFIVIFCDDLGYGDLGVFGHPTIKTPNLDRLANEGQKWTNFYAAASVCTPSRAGLLTGRLPVRSGMASSKRRVLFPDSKGGLPSDETTIAEILKQKNYATACVGKWHLGHLPQYLPTEHGFDFYYGIPYSNDMDRVAERGIKIFENPKSEYWNVPILHNKEIIERPANQNTITKRYTEKAIQFIKDNNTKPFFIYLAHSMPHVPLFVSNSFRGKSLRGLYGDVIEEIDWSVGQIVKTLRQEGLASNTLIVFTSDNGPWLVFDEQGGSAGLLKEGKGMTWEGGMREPTIFWWPDKIKPAVIADIGSTLDLLPTIAALAEADQPTNKVLDGYNLEKVLAGTGSSPRKSMYFYRGSELYALRYGQFKAHFITQFAYRKDNQRMVHDPPLLYNLEHDPSEKYNIAEGHPEILEQIIMLKKEHEEQMVMGEDQLARQIN
jgi:arylsulfatase A-like enzyme